MLWKLLRAVRERPGIDAVRTGAGVAAFQHLPGGVHACLHEYAADFARGDAT